MSLNIGHTEFPDQQGGLMICGYEWGGGDETDGEAEDTPAIDLGAECTFANKHLRYGAAALGWPYDRRIKKWFELWGYPLDQENPGTFEKSIIQTNWCNSQNPQMNGDYSSLWAPEQVDNFLNHISHFLPKLIFFMGSKLTDALQFPSTLQRFEALVGKCTKPLEVIQKDFEGRRFKISFQTFEHCDVMCFPHPSASRGLRDDYISLFQDEVAKRITDYTLSRYLRKKSSNSHSSDA